MVQISRKIRADQKKALTLLAKKTGIIDSVHIRRAIDEYFIIIGFTGEE